MRIVHYINQFFGQIGGEAEAYYPLEVREGIVGPGMALKAALGDDIQIVATIICGDNYFVENLEQTKKQVADTLKKYNVDLLVAGPAFNAGRYGMACGGACEAAYEAGVNAVSGMFEENPGIELYHKYGYIVYTDNNARGMRKAVESMAHLIKKMATGEEIKDSASEGYAMRGIRKNYFLEETGAERSINMLLKKINGESFETELPMPVFEKFEPSPAVNELSKATILVMTSGGMVPLGNPDHLEACNCTKFRKYSLEDDYCGKGVTKGQVVHGGYDPTYGNENGNRILPVDILFDMEKEGVIGKLYDNTFVTVGNGMGTDQAADFGDAIAQELKKDQIDGVILTST